MSRLLILLVIASLLAGCGSTGFVQETNAQLRPGTGFITQTTTLNGQQRGYTLFLPESYSPSKTWPTILFIHGYLAGGSDGVRPVSQGLGKYIADHPKEFPFIVLFPQSDKGAWHRKRDREEAIALLHQMKKEYAIDPDRVSLIGVSTGAHGAWQIAAD